MKSLKFSSTFLLVASVILCNAWQSNAQSKPIPKARFDDAIRPFRVYVPTQQLQDLKTRIERTKWPDRELVPDRSQGVQLENLKRLMQYWSKKYNWKKAEARLNSFPQFLTNIEGLNIHFIHVRSKNKNALPIILTHGWPGSIFEFLEVIGPLTDPVKYGGKADDAFHVVIPSLPGYGFSEKPKMAGWDPEQIAKTWGKLMLRLGYTHYVAQGGDWGAPVSHAMGRQAPKGLIGIHINLPAAIPPEVTTALMTGAPSPASLSKEEREVYDVLFNSVKRGNSAYNTTMTARPQILGYGVSDSPAFLAAWMLGHPGFSEWQFGNNAYRPTRDEVLDNFTLYWITNTGSSAGRIYWENMGRAIIHSSAQRTTDISLPVAVSVFPGDVYKPPLTWVRRAYPSLIYFNQAEKGGHFAAWEEPQLFVEELRNAFRSLRLGKVSHLPNLENSFENVKR